MISKPFLLTFLGAAMAFQVPNHPLIPIACFLAMIGDIFLLFNKKILFFYLGASFFASSHILNIITQGLSLSYDIPMYAYFFLFGGALIVALLLYFITKMAPNSLMKYCFSTCHILNIGFSFMLMMDHKIYSGLMILVGYLLCATSDVLLEKVTFKNDMKRRDFYIMGTYLPGQAFTYLGLLFATLSLF